MLPGGLIVVGTRGPRGRRSAKMLQGALLFREEQGFGWPWPGMLMALLAALTFTSVSLSFGFGMWTQLALGRPWGHHPMSDSTLLAVGSLAILGSLLPLSALFARLTVEVRTDGIRVRFTRLGGGQTLLRGEVDQGRIVRLGILDIGRTQKWRRQVYRLSGSEGVELRKTKGGGVVIVSSERPRAFLAAVHAMLDPKPGR
jgi:hypothetical protein